MKRYVPIIIGLVALGGVLYVGNKDMSKGSDESIVNATSTSLSSKSFQGKITRVYEGENVLEYGMDIPETATATVSMDGALVKITDLDMPVLAMYISYEGGRGYTPADYITNNIMPKVKGVSITGTTTVGGYDWDVAESEGSVWHVAKSGNGSWLLVVENKKDVNEKAMPIIESIVAQ
jgi:hypothetical protein